MTRRSARGALAVALLLVAAACQFEPDLSRFPACGEDGACPAGSTCLAEARRCLPDCGAQGPCVPDGPASDAGATEDGGDDGGLADAGRDAGTEDAGTDAGTEDAGTDAGVDAGTSPTLRFAGPAPLADAYDGTSYTEQVYALGGTPPYQFSLADGELPTGLTLLDGGQVTGTPSGTGKGSFSVRVTDSDTPARTVEGTASLEVLSAPIINELTITTRAVPDGRVGQKYRYPLRAAFHTGELTWTLSAGVLPPGLRVDAEGVITGTPEQATALSFTMQVQDRALSGSAKTRTFSITVYPAE